MAIINLFWNKDQKRIRAFWRLSIQIIILFILIPLGSLPIILLQMISPIKLTDAGFNPALEMISAVIMALAILFSVWLCGRWLDHRPFRDLGFHFSRQWAVDFAFGLALGAFLMILIFAAEYLFGWIDVRDYFHSSTPAISFESGLFQSFVIFILVGIYEETFSRGYQLRNLAEGLNLKAISPKSAVIIAWILSSSFFGILHAGNPNATFISTLNLVAAGLFLGFGFVLTGDLAISIGLHMTWNFFQGNVFGFPVSGSTPISSFIAITQKGNDWVTGGGFGPEAGAIGLFAILLGCILIATWVHYTRHDIKIQDCLAEYIRPGSPNEINNSTDLADADAD